jgi:hypothetical protein
MAEHTFRASARPLRAPSTPTRRVPV